MDKSKIVKYVKNLGAYFGASLIPMIFNLISNPFIAMNMSPEDYAIVGYYSSFTSLLQPLITFYMFHYYMKRYYELDADDRIILRATLTKSLIWFSGVLAVISTVCVIIYMRISGADTSIPLFPYVLMTLLSIPLTGIYTLTTTDYRISRMAGSFFKISVINGLLLVFLNVTFVVILKWNAFGKLLAPLLTNVLFFTFCLYRYRELLRLKFDWTIYTEMIKFCWPLTIAAMFGFFSNGYERVLLERLGNTIELGYYCVGLQIATYLNVFQTAVSSTFQPDIFQSVAENNNIRLAKISILQIMIISVVVLFFVALCPFVVNLLTAGRYMLSVTYSRILSLSVITGLIYNTFSQITIAYGYSKLPLVNKLLSSFILILMYSFLISKYQFIGAAWGITLSYCIFFIGNVILFIVFKKLRYVFKNS